MGKLNDRYHCYCCDKHVYNVADTVSIYDHASGQVRYVCKECTEEDKPDE